MIKIYYFSVLFSILRITRNYFIFHHPSTLWKTDGRRGPYRNFFLVSSSTGCWPDFNSYRYFFYNERPSRNVNRYRTELVTKRQLFFFARQFTLARNKYPLVFDFRLTQIWFWIRNREKSLGYFYIKNKDKKISNFCSYNIGISEYDIRLNSRYVGFFN